MNASKLFGLDVVRGARTVARLPRYFRELGEFRRMTEASRQKFGGVSMFPMVLDRDASAGSASGHYFHQDLFVAQKIFAKNPRRHVDVGSRVDGFVAHVASFRKIEVVDIRPLSTEAGNISFRVADATDSVSLGALGRADSVSCLHALEHFGLGRYGDPLRVDGHEVALRSIASMVETSGTFYVSVPIGRQRTEFNSHRVFDVTTLPRLLREDFELVGFSYVNDDGDLIRHWEEASEESRDIEATIRRLSPVQCRFGCGIYEFRKFSASMSGPSAGRH